VESKTVKMVVKDLLSADNERRKEDVGLYLVLDRAHISECHLSRSGDTSMLLQL